MAKRHIILEEIKELIEKGEYQIKEGPHGWIFHHFPKRSDNLVCAAIVNEESIIIKTVMIDWRERKIE